jgi:adenylyltransferase/sulfurtransferase
VPSVEATVADGAAEDARARLAAAADVVVTCAPDLGERLAWNAAAVRAGTPLVEGAVHGVQAQVTTVVPRESACLACLFGASPPPSADAAPVPAPVAAVVAGVVALEVVKLVARVGDPLVHRLWTLDVGAATARTLETRRRPDCAVCGAESDQARD